MLTQFLNPSAEFSRWITFACTTLLATCGGSLYGFGGYSLALSSLLPGVGHVDMLGSFGDFGLFSGIFMGMFYDRYSFFDCFGVLSLAALFTMLTVL